MSAVPVPPEIRSDDRWELVEESEESLGGSRLVRVESHRKLYGDRTLRDRVRAATGIDQLWRSFFVAKLTTSPALTPRIADLVVRSIAAPQARSRFARDLEQRGFEAVSEGETSRIRVDTGQRARITRFRAQVPLDGGRPLDVDAWLAIWDRETYVLVAGGIYPAEALGRTDEDLFDRPDAYRERLFDLIRAVGD